MLDRIPERLRTAAEGVEKATQMMADAKSKRNQAAGDAGANYQGLPKERTAEWQAADMIERYEQFMDFVNLWCNRKGKISDGERLSVIKHHPTAQARLKIQPVD